MNDLIKSGRYQSKSEILRDGLRAVEEREARREVELEELRLAVRAGMDSGPGIAATDLRDRLTRKYQDKNQPPDNAPDKA